MAITSGLKLNVNKIKSPFGSSSAIPKISAGGGLFGIKPQAGIKPSSILTDPGTLVGQVKGDIANIDRTIAVEKRVSANEKNITILKKILQNQKEAGNRELAQTNEILKDIGNALALDFANRIQDSRDRLAAQRKALAAQRRRDKEEGIEGKDKIDKDKSFLSKTFDKVTAPIKGIFGKIFDFFSILGAGILVKGAFDWLQNPENLDKAKSMFKWLTENWTWIVGAVTVGGVALAVGGLTTAIGGMVKLFTGIGGLLTAISPVGWAILAIAAITGGTFATMSWMDRRANRKAFGDNEDFIERGVKTQMVLTQYGRGATEQERDKFLTTEEKKEYQMLLIYDGMLRRRGNDYNQLLKWQKQLARNEKAWAKRGLDINNLPEFEQGVYNRVSGRVAEFQEKVDLHNRDIAMFEEQFTIKGESIEDVYSRFPAFGPGVLDTLLGKGQSKWNTSLPQTGISEAGDGTSYGLGYSIKQNKNGMDTGGRVFGKGGPDEVSTRLTAGEFVIQKDEAQKIGYQTLTALNNGDVFTSLQKGVQLQSENNKSPKRINDQFRNVLIGFNTQLANVAASRNTGGSMKPTPRSRPNISAVPKQIGGILVKPRKSILANLPLQQAEIDARTVKENASLQRQEELLVKSRAGRMGSDIEIGPYDPSNEYWVAQAYDSYGFPGWSDLL